MKFMQILKKDSGVVLVSKCYSIYFRGNLSSTMLVYMQCVRFFSIKVFTSTYIRIQKNNKRYTL